MNTTKIKFLETHRYAPELNRIHLKNGVIVSAKGATSIKEAKKVLGRGIKPSVKPLHCVITSFYSDNEYKSLNRVAARGLVDDRLSALRFSKQFKQKGGPLIDGDILPPNKIKLKFKILA